MWKSRDRESVKTGPGMGPHATSLVLVPGVAMTVSFAHVLQAAHAGALDTALKVPLAQLEQTASLVTVADALT